MDVQALINHESRKEMCPNGLKEVARERRWMGSVDTGWRCVGGKRKELGVGGWGWGR